jgi:hypothetical protein
LIKESPRSQRRGFSLAEFIDLIEASCEEFDPKRLNHKSRPDPHCAPLEPAPEVPIFTPTGVSALKQELFFTGAASCREAIAAGVRPAAVISAAKTERLSPTDNAF